MKLLKVILKILIGLVFLFLIFIPPSLYNYYRKFVYKSVESVPGGDLTLIVLGAAVKPDQTPSAALAERLEVAQKLFADGKISKIIVSGAKDSEYYNEAKVMKSELVSKGVPESIIIEDDSGYRTYDSCKRAKDVYGVTKAIVVSQGYHLPRALFLCKSFGIDSTGVYSVGNFSTYYSRWYTVREVFAMYKAVWDVYIGGIINN